MTGKAAQVAAGATRRASRTIEFHARGGRVALRLALAVLVLGLGSSARAQVSCNNPNNLCLGDPCVIGKIEVISPCIVDFGARTVVFGGLFKVPNGGTLDLQARTIRVEHPIDGRHTSELAGAGSMIELNATGDLIVDRRIDASARTAPGTIVLTAGGNIELNAPVRAKTKGRHATSPGGTVLAIAMGTLSSLGGGRIEVAGGPSSNGGAAQLAGRAKVDLRGRIDARGAKGGNITLMSDKGTLVARRKLEADGRRNEGGTIVLHGGGGVVLQKKVLATGRTLGGSVVITGGTVQVEGFVRARSRSGPGGSVTISTTGDAVIGRELVASGVTGGSIALTSSAGDLLINGSLDAKAKSGIGGTVEITATSGDVLLNDVVDADGGDGGGTVSITGQSITLTEKSGVLAEGEVGGQVSLNGVMAEIHPGSDLDVDGELAGGEVRIVSTGDLVLSGGFRARGDVGGIIEAQAGGNLTANGDFQSDADGCTGLAAGGTLDTGAGNFDGPIAMSCP